MAVYGADTRIGCKLIALLKQNNLGVLPRPVHWAIGKSANEIRADVKEKQPAVILNCLIDPDSGDLPVDETAAYVAVTQSLVSQAKQAGSRYIHCSSSRIYGTSDKPEQGKCYAEYDSVLVKGDDPWRQLIAATERTVLLHTLLANPVASRTANDRFGFYVARFGHVIGFGESRSQRFPAVHTLSACLEAATQSNCTLVCDNPDYLLTPLSVAMAARCVADLCEPSCPAPYGFYNIGSSNSVTLRQICTQLAIRHGVYTSLVPSSDRRDAKVIYGVDSNQGVDSSWWLSRGLRKLPAWQAAISELMVDRDLCAV